MSLGLFLFLVAIAVLGYCIYCAWDEARTPPRDYEFDDVDDPPNRTYGTMDATDQNSE